MLIAIIIIMEYDNNIIIILVIKQKQLFLLYTNREKPAWVTLWLTESDLVS